MTLEVKDYFERANETTLSGTGWTANGIGLTNFFAVPNASIYSPNPPTVDVTYAYGWAYLSGTGYIPQSAGQQVRASCISTIENVDPLATNTLGIGGDTGTFTLTSAHGRTIGTLGLMTIAGFSGYTPAIDGTWVVTFTAADEFTIDFGESIAEGSTVLGTAESDDAFARIWARLDENVDSTDFDPRAGYGLLISYQSDTTIDLRLQKYDKANGGIVTLATAAAVSGANTVSSTYLGVQQDLRLTVEDLPDGTVKLRGYLNQDIDTSPAVEVIDYGASSGSFIALHRDPGFWGFDLGAPGTAVEAFLAEDDWQYPPDDPFTGRTLAELRTDLGYELTRGNFVSGGTNLNLPDALMNYWIRKAHDNFRNKLGDRPLFLRKEETFTLTFDSQHVADLPDKIDSIAKIYDASTRKRYVFELLDYTVGRGLKIRIPHGPSGTSRNFIISYMMRTSELLDDDDRSWVPRQYDGCIVLMATRMAASRAGEKTWVLDIQSREQEAIRDAMRDMVRLKRQESPSFRVAKRRIGRGRERWAPEGNAEYLYGNF